MAATTSNRDQLFGEGWIYDYGVASGTHIYAGTIVAIGASGYLTNHAGLTTTPFVGVAVDEKNNTGVAGAVNCRVRRRGVFKFVANGTPAQVHIGTAAYILDNQTVGVSTATAQSAGKIVGIGSNYYDIQIDNSVN